MNNRNIKKIYQDIIDYEYDKIKEIINKNQIILLTNNFNQTKENFIKENNNGASINIQNFRTNKELVEFIGDYFSKEEFIDFFNIYDDNWKSGRGKDFELIKDYIVEKNLQNNIRLIEHETTYINKYIGKEDGKFYEYVINSGNISIKDQLNKISNIEELKLFYDIEKKEIDKSLFLKYLKNEINISCKKIINSIGLDVTYMEKKSNNSEQKNEIETAFYLRQDLRQDLYKSIKKYLVIDLSDEIYNKFIKYRKKNNELNNISKDEVIELFMTEHRVKELEDEIYLRAEYFYKISSAIIKDNISKEDNIDNIKNILNNSKDNFKKFVEDNHQKIVDMFKRLYLNNKVYYNPNSLYFKNDEHKKIFNSLDLSNKYDILKCSVTESFFNKGLNLNSIKEDIDILINNSIKKKLDGKIYNIDFKNNHIEWIYENKEEEQKYNIQNKNKIKEIRMNYNTRVKENNVEDKDASRKEISKILNERVVEVDDLLNIMDYSVDDAIKSKLNSTITMFDVNIDVLHNNFVYALKKLKSEYYIENKEFDNYQNNNFDFLKVLSDIVAKYNVNSIIPKENQDKIYEFIKAFAPDFNMLETYKIYLRESFKMGGEENFEVYKNIFTEFMDRTNQQVLKELSYLSNKGEAISMDASILKDPITYQILSNIARDYNIYGVVREHNNIKEKSKDLVGPNDEMNEGKELNNKFNKSLEEGVFFSDNQNKQNDNSLFNNSDNNNLFDMDDFFNDLDLDFSNNNICSSSEANNETDLNNLNSIDI